MSEENYSTCPLCGVHSAEGSLHQPFCAPMHAIKDEVEALGARVTALETPQKGKHEEKHEEKKHERGGH
jgi:endogenous inhibitor of DNA gyrase (YacG/DUF329 family)